MMTHLRTKLDEEDERDADDEEMDAEYDEHGMSDWRQEDVYEDKRVKDKGNDDVRMTLMTMMTRIG